MDLSGKTALITGAAKRIGRVVAHELAEAGARIIIHYNKSRREAESLKEELLSLHAETWTVRCDFSPSGKKSGTGKIKKFLSEVYRITPRLDILVNNAAIYYPAPLRVKEADWDEFMTVNLKMPFFLAQEAGLSMKKQKAGKIINIVDWTGLRPHENYIPYAVSKAGLIAATQGLAKALAPYVQVNSIAPGPILPAAGHSLQHHKEAAKKTLMKRYGDPVDIARTVRFLCEGTDYITGAMIPVDGGGMLV